jgi:hypothetical protein
MAEEQQFLPFNYFSLSFPRQALRVCEAYHAALGTSHP